jgi:hypothetical protein
MSSSMPRMSPQPTPRCKLPAPSGDGLIATVAQDEPEFSELVQLTAELYPRALELEKALLLRGIAVDHIGLGAVSSTNVMHHDNTRWWIFGPKLQTLSSYCSSIVQGLHREGVWIDPKDLHVVWGMPIQWHPLDTMERFSQHVFRGCVVDDLRALGVPIRTEAVPWAYWLGVRVANLPGQPAIVPMPFR